MKNLSSRLREAIYFTMTAFSHCFKPILEVRLDNPVVEHFQIS
jgi:hypothetical protein